VLAMMAVMAGCTTSLVDRAEHYLGSSRELWDDGRPDVRTSDVLVDLVDDGETALVTIDGCTLTLRRDTGVSEPMRRFQLVEDEQRCDAGMVDQALVGDPVRREPPEPGAELSIELWLTREDGAPSLIEFTGQRVN
jgi:hypothetical protein